MHSLTWLSLALLCALVILSVLECIKLDPCSQHQAGGWFTIAPSAPAAAAWVDCAGS